MAPSVEHDDKKQNLIRVAGEVFAEMGFEKATVRDICSRAGSNVASINYYFGDKQKLYQAVLEFAQCCVKDMPPVVSDSAVPARTRLEIYVHGFLHSVLDDGRPSWHSRLMAREMMEPTAALDLIVDQHIRVNFKLLVGIVSAYFPANTDPDMIEFHACSIIGQCLFYRHCEPVIKRVNPTMAYSQENIARIANHITQFSHNALSAAAAALKGGEHV